MWLHQNKHQGSMKNILERDNKINFKMEAKEKKKNHTKKMHEYFKHKINE
jgi:hypothetical protein